MSPIVKATSTGKSVPSESLKAIFIYYLALPYLKGALAKAKYNENELYNLINETEARIKLGERPMTEEDRKELNVTLSQERAMNAERESLRNNANKNTSNNISKPKNQHGERSAPKLSKNDKSLFERIKNSENLSDVLKMLENY